MPAMKRVALSGFADPRVSESVYLDDPEGNGAEVLTDHGWLLRHRPPRRHGGICRSTVRQADVSTPAAAYGVSSASISSIGAAPFNPKMHPPMAPGKHLLQCELAHTVSAELRVM
jgi:hypothetical protein